jgi:3-hydroxyisobutyrate dehydrogenase-like beta-hydroxyacid dehydrogenase
MSPATNSRKSIPGTVAVLGLGEAGAKIAADLGAAGVSVVGFDPAATPTPAGVVRVDSEAAALEGARIILSVNSEAVAVDVAKRSAPGLGPGNIYADLNTGPPALKRLIAERVGTSGCRTVDVALMAPVTGISTPVLVSGDGARAFLDFFAPLGMPVTVIEGDAGAAAGRKLLRSIFMKGFAIATTEALRSASATGSHDWLYGEIANTLNEADTRLLERLVKGSVVHAARRKHEMAAAAELSEEADVPSFISRACVEWFELLDQESVKGQL